MQKSGTETIGRFIIYSIGYGDTSIERHTFIKPNEKAWMKIEDETCELKNKMYW